MSWDPLDEILEVLADAQLEEAEIFHKKGRSRTLRTGPGGRESSLRQEEGWAVRAGDARRSFFYCAAGAPDPEAPWPEADGQGLRLPSPKPIPAFAPAAELDTPILGENEAEGLFAAIRAELERELPGAKLVRGFLEDGSSESFVASSRQVRASARHRTASLFLEASAPRSGLPHSAFTVAEREARRFHPPTLARRLADRLALAERGSAPLRDRGGFLLGYEVMIALIQGLSRLWIGPDAAQAARGLTDRQGRLASRIFTLVDDGRLPGGILEAPIDGEGLPTREMVIVDGGVYRQPLLAWHEVSSRARAVGCSRRPSWRDLPKTGPSHLYLAPDPANSVADLLAELRRGYYLSTSGGPAQVEEGFRRFAVPVSGFAIEDGQPTGSITGAWLTGTVTALLSGILAVGRDLSFSPVRGGLLGAPSVLVKGLELRQRF